MNTLQPLSAITPTEGSFKPDRTPRSASITDLSRLKNAIRGARADASTENQLGDRQRRPSSSSGRSSPMKAVRSMSSSLATNHVPKLAATLSHSVSSASIAPSLSKYDNRNLAAAIERAEHRSENRLDVKAGDVGQVGAVGFGGGDEWQNVCVRVLPLFNGEGVKANIEDLNELVARFAQRIAHRSPTRCCEYLTQHLLELLSTGMLTIRDKFQANVDDSFLLYQLNDLWTHFYSSSLPYVEAIFLPFATDPQLVQSISRTAQPPINVRRLSLISFRDHLIIPLVERLAPMMARDALPSSRRSSKSELLTSADRMSQEFREVHTRDQRSQTALTASTARATRMQMLAILSTVDSNDEEQDAIRTLELCLRGIISTSDLGRRGSVRSMGTYRADFSMSRTASSDRRLSDNQSPYARTPDTAVMDWSDGEQA